MADEPEESVEQQPEANESAQMHATRSMDPRYQRNFAERLFPGPSKPMSDQVQRRIEGLLKALDANQQRQAGQPRRDRRDAEGKAVEGGSARHTSIAPPPAEPVATPEDIAKLHESLDAQTELLRAILASQVDTQNDARSTAQNSRTFAWAGTAIALLTLIATVLSIIAAINAG